VFAHRTGPISFYTFSVRLWEKLIPNVHIYPAVFHRLFKKVVRPKAAVIHAERVGNAIAVVLEAADHVVIVAVTAIGRIEAHCHRDHVITGKRRAHLSQAPA